MLTEVNRNSRLILRAKTMTDYIKREDAEQIMYSYGIGGTMFVDDFLKPSESEEARQKEVWESVRKVLDRVAVKDVAPIRHGHWIDEGAYADYTNVHAWRCSECEDHILKYKCDLPMYCENCGARMDGGDD